MNWFKKILGFLSKEDKDPFFLQLENLLGQSPQNLPIYRLAFQHKSKNKESNERLEFLGDSILDAVISEIIYKHFPQKDEGELSQLRSKMVSRNMLNFLSNQLGLLQYLNYRPTHQGQGLQNIEGNTLEALIGAIYLDLGFENSKRFILNKLVNPYIDWKNIEGEIIDYKSLLYAYSQRQGLSLAFDTLQENFKDPNERFEIGLKINHELKAQAFGKSKKVAEQLVAKNYLEAEGLL
jgi:ribonuclease-3